MATVTAPSADRRSLASGGGAETPITAARGEPHLPLEGNHDVTEAKTTAQSELMVYRPISQMLQLFVLPELDRRVGSGVIAEGSLPLQVHAFRVVQPGPGHIVELNEEVQLQLQVKVKTPVEAGQPVRLRDIYPDSSVLQPPIVDGEPKSYYLLQSGFLNLRTMFDFTQGELDGIGPAPPMQFPIAEFAHMQEFLKTVKPVEKFKQIAHLNWPPAPGYFPDVIAYAHHNAKKLRGREFADTVSASYNEQLWQTRMDLWTETEFFSGRLNYIRKAVDEYFEGDWISSIYVIVPQFEGIIKDYLQAAGKRPRSSFGGLVDQLRTLVFSRKVLLFPSPVLELILNFLKTGTFWSGTANIRDPRQQVNRHGIVHGVFTSFEARDIALKYLVLMDALALVILHDRIVSDVL